LKKKLKIKIASSSSAALLGADFIFLCVKPQQMKALLEGIQSQVTEKQCLVSIAAGVESSTIEKPFSLKIPVVRVMPNTPALVQCGMSVVTPGRFARTNHLVFVKRFLASISQVMALPESQFDSVTALSGSGPAYLFYLTESLMQAGEKIGLSKSVADQLSRQTILGAAKMLQDGASPTELRQKVTSPGGTTEAALTYLKRKQWSQNFIKAVQKARDRSKELRTQSF
jgi:pyrroline-5-carboxylate reductase